MVCRTDSIDIAITFNYLTRLLVISNNPNKFSLGVLEHQLICWTYP